MQNIKELTELLSDNIDKIMSDEMPLAKAKEVSNAAGKILSACKVELEYNKYRGYDKEIPFLETN